MSNLYEISREIEACVKLDENRYVNEDTGEIIDTEALNTLKMERDTKIENIALWYKNLEAEAEMLSAESASFAKRAKAAKSKADQLKKYLAGFLNGSPFKTIKTSIWFKSSTAVEWDGNWLEMPADLSAAYLKFPEPVLDKTKAKNALKAGIKIPGCTLKQNSNIQIK